MRNGHLPERTVLTGAGPLEVRQPRVRDRAGKDAPDRVQFTSAILPPYLRRSSAMDGLIPWLYLKGISAADMSEALQPLIGAQRFCRGRPQAQGGMGARTAGVEAA